MDEKRQDSRSSGFRFEEIEHTADVGLRVQGKDLKAMIENAALGMAAIVCDDSFLSDDRMQQMVEVEADDREGLLVEWLSELVFLLETNSFIFQGFHIENISETHLKAKVYGKVAEELKVHIKAVTYHNLNIIETNDGLEATVVFDI
jgi:SHS2 domain-containing protein